MLKMQKGDISVFEECFSFACPKFISPIPPNYENAPANSHLVRLFSSSSHFIKKNDCNTSFTEIQKADTIYILYFQDPFNLQLRMFMVEVQQQSIIPVIRRFVDKDRIHLKIYKFNKLI